MIAKELTSEQIALAKNSGALAAEVCVQYKNLVKKIARKFFLQTGDEEDLIQEGMIGLYKAISKYDSSKGAFSTYATICVKSEIISAIRKSTSQKNLAHGMSIERDNLTEVLPCSECDFEKLAEFNEHEERLRNIKKFLSRREAEVLELYLEGFSYAQMAESAGSNTKSIENTIKRIRFKLKENFKR